MKGFLPPILSVRNGREIYQADFRSLESQSGGGWEQMWQKEPSGLWVMVSSGFRHQGHPQEHQEWARKAVPATPPGYCCQKFPSAPIPSKCCGGPSKGSRGEGDRGQKWIKCVNTELRKDWLSVVQSKGESSLTNGSHPEDGEERRGKKVETCPFGSEHTGLKGHCQGKHNGWCTMNKCLKYLASGHLADNVILTLPLELACSPLATWIISAWDLWTESCSGEGAE